MHSLIRKLEFQKRAQLDRIMQQDELKWKQGAKITEPLEGEDNTNCLHAKANGRR